MAEEPLGIFVIVLDPRKRVLLGQRKNSYKAGTFGCPGGRLELTETLEAGAKRELFEETGLKTKNLKYVGVIREFQAGYNFIHFAFVCNDYEGDVELKEPDKCLEWNFYSVDNLPEEILPGHLAGIRMLNGANKGYIDIIAQNT